MNLSPFLQNQQIPACERSILANLDIYSVFA